MEMTPLTVLATIALALMTALTGGIVYLTLAEWRDRRRRDRDKKMNAPKGKK